MLKVMTILGTRPELIKMSRVIDELDRQVHHVLVHSGQNYDYELNNVFFDDLEIRKPDYFLEAAGENAAQTIAQVIEKSDAVMAREKPDAVLLYGDTNTCLAVISAKRRKIPVFHMEAGNRCFDQRVPEELNRKVIDHLSDINMVLTEHARRYLIAEGIPAETILKTGSHMKEVLEYYLPKVRNSAVIEALGLEENKYFIVSIHREENVDSAANLQGFLDALIGLAQTWNYPIIISTHPRTRKQLNAMGDTAAKALSHPLIRFSKPFGLLDYLKLQMGAFCVISDSGTITEEASLLSLPAVTLRMAHERPEGMDEGTLVMCDLEKSALLDAVKLVTSQHDRETRIIPLVQDYDGGPVSKKIVRIVLSYTAYINRTVWRKY